MISKKTSFLIIFFLSLALTFGLASSSSAECGPYTCNAGESCIDKPYYNMIDPSYNTSDVECCADRNCNNLGYGLDADHYGLGGVCVSGSKDCCVKRTYSSTGAWTTAPLLCDVTEEIYTLNDPVPLPYDSTDPYAIHHPKEQCCQSGNGGMGLNGYCCPKMHYEDTIDPQGNIYGWQAVSCSISAYGHLGSCDGAMVQCTSEKPCCAWLCGDGQPCVVAQTTITSGSNGSTVTTSPNGTIVITYPDGSTVTTLSDGTTITTDPSSGTTINKQDGVCGPAEKNYLATDTVFSGDFCNPGVANPNPPSFPGPGGSSTWVCSGINGGNSSRICTATRSCTIVCSADTDCKICNNFDTCTAYYSNKSNDIGCTSDGNSCTSDVCNDGACAHTVSGTHLVCFINSCTPTANTSSTCTNQNSCTSAEAGCNCTVPSVNTNLSFCVGNSCPAVVGNQQVVYPSTGLNRYGVCKKVTNTSANSYFIPTQTAGEWSSFYTHPPTGVTAPVPDCCP